MITIINPDIGAEKRRSSTCGRTRKLCERTLSRLGFVGSAQPHKCIEGLIYEWLSLQKSFSMPAQVFLALYKCETNPTRKLKRLCKCFFFLMHSQIFLVLNIRHRNPQVFAFKRICSVHHKHAYMRVVTFLHQLLDLHWQTARGLCVKASRLPRREAIYKCVFFFFFGFIFVFNRETSVANHTSPCRQRLWIFQSKYLAFQNNRTTSVLLVDLYFRVEVYCKIYRM